MANKVFIVMVALQCVKRYSKKKNLILRFSVPASATPNEIDREVNAEKGLGF